MEYSLFESRVLLSDLVHRLQLLESGGATGASGGGGRTADELRQTIPSAPADVDRTESRRAHARTGTGRVQDMGMETVSWEAEAVLPAPDSAAPQTAASTAAAAAETVPGWTGFIQVLLDSQPGLASCLMEGLPSLDAQRNRLVVGFPLEKTFHMQRLSQERHTLEEKMTAHWGRPLKLELVATASQDTGDLRNRIRRKVAPTEQELLESACRQDRPLADLVELLQGESLPLQERETWRQSLHETDQKSKGRAAEESGREAPSGSGGHES